MQSGPSGGAPSLNSSQISSDQTKANVNAGVSSARLNNVNQVTPFGNLNYGETGGQYDFNGNWIPQFTATTSLSPGQQGLLDSRTGAQQGLFNLASGLMPQVQAGLDTKLPSFGALPDTKAYTDQAYRALTARSNEDIGRGENSQRVLNANQGIAAGSDAFNRSFQPFERSRVDASTQATIGAQGLADQLFNREISGRDWQTRYAQLQQRNPLENYASVLGLAGGASMPQFVNTPQTQVQAPDVTSPALAAFSAQNQDYQRAQQQATSSNNALLGGVFGLGGSVLGGLAGGPAASGLFGLGSGGFGMGSTRPGGVGRAGSFGANF